jgi:hypothetical protein
MKWRQQRRDFTGKSPSAQRGNTKIGFHKRSPAAQDYTSFPLLPSAAPAAQSIASGPESFRAFTFSNVCSQESSLSLLKSGKKLAFLALRSLLLIAINSTDWSVFCPLASHV